MAVAAAACLAALTLALPVPCTAANGGLGKSAMRGWAAGDGGSGGAMLHRRSRSMLDTGSDSSRSSSSAQKPYDTCVCVFDFDETLRVISKDKKDFDVPAEDGQGIIRKCKEYGWEIGVASANDNYQKLQKVLSERVDNVTFTPEFFSSTAFQYHWFNKSISLNNIARYYDTQPQCMMLFDDAEHNRKYADKLNVTFIKVRNDTGVRWEDFTEGQKYMHQKCWCASPKFTPHPTDEELMETFSDVIEVVGGPQPAISALEVPAALPQQPAGTTEDPATVAPTVTTQTFLIGAADVTVTTFSAVQPQVSFLDDVEKGASGPTASFQMIPGLSAGAELPSMPASATTAMLGANEASSGSNVAPTVSLDGGGEAAPVSLWTSEGAPTAATASPLRDTSNDPWVMGMQPATTRTGRIAAAPTGSMAAPTGGMAAPTGGMAAPTGGMAAPTGGMAAPTGGMAAPTGGMAAPTGGMAAPTGGMAAPTGGMAAPTGGMAAPTGGMAAPTGGMAAPTDSMAPGSMTAPHDVGPEPGPVSGNDGIMSPATADTAAADTAPSQQQEAFAPLAAGAPSADLGQGQGQGQARDLGHLQVEDHEQIAKK
ncbi:hypothetical protein VOLCADRAFT_93384 [Volvox carteri f. nagariensis]|uniref:FCP1 homology domain-containing protein n=1 Tax=Volvox carteri f. nagariensis TaxID=3068 RepID=D8U1Z7_VOLCA|nr:uncharacterized protein VOLCADRAFT_93384 [Volvox carteri f. nagariensis]EFJ46196.1 hypothetical protein VOLCADRAFT_93384 [Volvox carteri f. nagariensis]|eukprot:XP_002952643.1 hypothetical protein VOLCADRAFT_93384 [Volvox carteri f. nagariensis]